MSDELLLKHSVSVSASFCFLSLFSHDFESVDQWTLTRQVMAKQLRNSAKEEVMMKHGNKEEVVRGMTEEVRGVSSVTYDLTLVCKGGATVRKFTIFLDLIKNIIFTRWGLIASCLDSGALSTGPLAATPTTSTSPTSTS